MLRGVEGGRGEAWPLHCNLQPLSCFSDMDDLAEVKSSAGLSIWREDNPVHLTAAAYNDIAAVLLNQAKNNGNKPSVGQLRRRLVSVIPAPSTTAPAVREPEWISGEIRSARGGHRGGQHGRFCGGQWGGRGRSPWRGPRHYPY